MQKILFSTFLSLLSFSCAMASASAPQKYARNVGATPSQIQAAFDAAKAELYPSPMFSNPSLGLRKSPAIRPSRATGDVSALWAGAASFLKRKKANEESDARIAYALNEGWSSDSDEDGSWSSDEEEQGEISIAPMAGYVASQDARRMDILALKRESDLLDAKIAAMAKKNTDTPLSPHPETLRERTQATQRFFEENPEHIPVARPTPGKKLYGACRTISFQEHTDPNA
ncbi:MAG: hypothetical protein C0514_00765 [Candidatus Puniceispirillum sp.]|nr:hypothetical protein [Candidatus Puniceispirillum sp.]